MKKIFLLFPFIIVILFMVFNMQKKDLKYSFYHWQNSFNIKNSKEKLYIKVLDMDFSQKLEIVKTRFLSEPSKNFVPVIYITNKAMKYALLNELTSSVTKALKALPYEFNEIQFDCDWSLSTRAKYFDFLEKIKIEFDKDLSATIRLHQIKYAKKTGVPPVDYGVLMYYNMSDIGNFNTKNSILDNDVAKRYLYNFDKYPLRLKLALPLYSQAIQFRGKRPIDIFEGVRKKDFIKNFKELKQNYFEVIKSFYFKGRYIYKGDILRFENPKYEDLKIALKDFFKKADNPYDEIIFYTLKYKSKYDLENLKKELN
jgi:hypothetical protein